MNRIVSRLKKARPVAGGFVACCPAHEDGKPSLSVTQADDGKVLVHCHAGCSPESIVKAAGLTMSDLFPPDTAAPEAPRRIVAVYDYRTKDNEPIFQAVRYEPKDFRQRRPDGQGGWIWSLKDVPRPLPLYRLPELLAADNGVFLVEGEKDAEAVRALGLTATCNPMGAGKWKDVDDSPLVGRRVCIIADKDGPGRKHAAEVAGKLRGRAALVKLMELPGGAVKDAADWIAEAERLGMGDIAGELSGLAKAAPEWAEPTDPRQPPQPSPAKSAVAEEFAAERDGRRQRVPLPWTQLDYMTKALKPGSVTIVGGPPGYGKSFLVLHLAIHAHFAGFPWALLPLEGKRTDWERRALAHMAHTWDVLDDNPETADARIAIAANHEADLEALIANVCENPTLPKVDAGGKARVSSLPYQSALDWAAEALTTKRLVIIDPLAKLEFPGFQPWAAEKDFVQQLVGIASHAAGSIVLVVHTVKRAGATAAAPLTQEDLQGAAELSRLVDTVLLLDTHSPKESDVVRAGCSGQVMHTRTLTVGKARFGSGMGSRIAMNMENASFAELGVIVPATRFKKGGTE